jgi:hypothetical protein
MNTALTLAIAAALAPQVAAQLGGPQVRAKPCTAASCTLNARVARAPYLRIRRIVPNPRAACS